MKKRLLSLLLTLCMILTLLPTVSVPALAADPGYTYDTGTKTLDITTDAGMTNWLNTYDVPQEAILKVSIGTNATANIGANIFETFYALTEIKVASGNTRYKDIDGVLFTADGTTLLRYPQAKTGTDYTVPSDVTTIEARAFSSCTALQNLTLSNKVATIGEYAFDHSTALKTVTIPASVTSFDMSKASPFYYCTSLETITVDPGNAAYSSADGVLFDKAGATLLRYPAAKVGAPYTVPSGTTTIGRQAFENSSKLTGVILPDTVTEIKLAAFRYCEVLATATFGTELKTIESDAFRYCNVLDGITIPAKVTDIKNDAFGSCKALKKVIIPPSVTAIGERAFYSCLKLKTVIIERLAAPGLGFGSFGSYPDKVKIRVIYHPKAGTGYHDMNATNWPEKYIQDRLVPGAAALADLKLSAGTLTPDFTPANESYTATVGKIDSLTVTPTNGNVETITVNGTLVPSESPSGAVSLSPGTNVIEVVATDEASGHTKTYTVTVTKTPWNGTYNNLSTDVGFNCGDAHLRVTMPSTDGYYTYGTATGGTLTQTGSNKASLPANWNWNVKYHNTPVNGANYTLTLKDAVWTTAFATGDALMTGSPLNLVLVGTNSITSTAAGKSAVSTNTGCALTIQGSGALNAAAGGTVIAGDTIAIKGGTITGISDGQALAAAPDFTGYTDLSFSVSTDKGGTNPTSYDPAQIATYKYFKVQPSPKHTVTFDAQGGAPVPAPVETKTDGKLASMPADPTKAGFNFAGWFTEAAGGDEVTTATPFAANTTIYAHWTAIPPAPPADDGYVPPKKPVIVDGKPVNIGAEKKSGSTTTLTPDQKRLTEEIGKAKDAGTVVVPVSKSATTVASLMVKNVEDMAAKNMTLSVETGGIRYDLPTAAMDVKALAAAFPGVDSAKIPFHVTIKESGVTVKDTVVTAKPTEFVITATSGGKTVSADQFSVFVDRSFEITKAQSEKITTAVVVEPDGKLRHVPTYVCEKGGKYYAVVKSMTNSVYALIQNEITFPDVKGKWYEDVANEVGSRKIVVGTDKGSFSGDENITRAEFAAMMVRALGLPLGKADSFTDVPADAWYAGAVATAAEYGLVKGIGAHQFNPAGLITRQEAYQMLYNASKRTGFPKPLAARNLSAEFSDLTAVSDWAQDSVTFCLNNNLSVHLKGSVSPTEEITRGEMSALILKLLQRSELVDVRSKL